MDSEFIALLNKERADRGLQELHQRDVLIDMAEHDYVGHVWPDGTTIEDRYRTRGLLSESCLAIETTNEYYPGAENAGQTWIKRNLITDSNICYISSEQGLAMHLFEMWMKSEGHRDAMPVSSTDKVGLGLNISSSGKVYAKLELC